MVLTSFLIITIYIIYTIIKYGIPHSLSATYYLINNKWIFSTVLAVSSMMILPIMLSEPYSFLCFFAVCGVLFVAASPNFKDDELEDLVHTYSAITTLITSQLWIGLNFSILLYWWIPFLIYLCILLKRYNSLSQILNLSNIKFYAELIMLFTIYSSLI